jgi:hypothetical protein
VCASHGVRGPRPLRGLGQSPRVLGFALRLQHIGFHDRGTLSPQPPAGEARFPRPLTSEAIWKLAA